MSYHKNGKIKVTGSKKVIISQTVKAVALYVGLVAYLFRWLSLTAALGLSIKLTTCFPSFSCV